MHRFRSTLMAAVALVALAVPTALAAVTSPVGAAPNPGGPLPVSAGGWAVTAAGAVVPFFGPSFGDLQGKALNSPIVGVASTYDSKGYWLVGSDGGVFAFGSAPFYGSMGGSHLNAPIVGIAGTPDGKGYWLVASDGGVFSFGDAPFYGSMAGSHLNAPVVSIAVQFTDQFNPGPATGYWLVASDGGVFAFGGAPFLGSAQPQITQPGWGATVTSAGSNQWSPGCFLTDQRGDFFYTDPTSPSPANMSFWLGSTAGVVAVNWVPGGPEFVTSSGQVLWLDVHNQESSFALSTPGPVIGAAFANINTVGATP